MAATKTKTEKTEATKQQEVLLRVNQLVQLAVQNDNEEEARSAAVQAAQLMAKHELVCVPRAELEAAQKVVSGAQQLATQAKKEKWTNMGIGLILGQVLLGKGGLKF
jgi:formiminotetrahydrofolate cyclodeaminase